MNKLDSTELVNYSTATQIAEQYQKRTARISELLRELSTEVDGLKDAFRMESGYLSDFSFSLYRNNERIALDDDGISSLIKHFKHAAWAVLIEKLSIKKLMSAKDREALDNQIYWRRGSHSGAPLEELPEITAETIVGVLQGFVQSAPELFEQKVLEVYRWLIPTNWKSAHITNKPDRVGQRVIKQYAVDLSYGPGMFRVHYERQGILNSLDTVFHSLDGMGVIDGHEGPLVSAIAISEDGTGETEYFRFKCFRNGNLHLQFKRLDLLDKFNEIAGDASRIGANRKHSGRA